MQLLKSFQISHDVNDVFRVGIRWKTLDFGVSCLSDIVARIIAFEYLKVMIQDLLWQALQDPLVLECLKGGHPGNWVPVEAFFKEVNK